MVKLRTALLAAAALGSLALGTQAANATFYVFYSTDGAASFTAFPGSPAADGGTIGTAGFTAGGITLGSSIFTNNAPNAGASSVPAFTNQTQVNATSTTGGHLLFAIVDNNFQGPTAQPLTFANAETLIQQGTTAGSMLSQTSCVIAGSATVDAGSVGGLCGSADATTPAPTSLTTAGLSGVSESQTTFASVSSLSAPFTIAQFFTLNLQPGANVLAQGSATMASVPEPVSLSLLAVGLIGVGAAGMRRKA